jgi:predicted dinucleotide-binding enzyme
MATVLGKIWAKSGHEIAVSYARDEAKLHATAEAIGHGARVLPIEEIPAFSDVVVLATVWDVAIQAVKAAKFFDEKILWTIVNPLKPDLTGVQVGTDTSASEQIAESASGARIVAGWPPFAEILASGSGLIKGEKAALFYCGDDRLAKETVAVLGTELGTHPVDCGPLTSARMAEPALALLVRLAYVEGMGPGGYKILN